MISYKTNAFRGVGFFQPFFNDAISHNLRNDYFYTACSSYLIKDFYLAFCARVFSLFIALLLRKGLVIVGGTYQEAVPILLERIGGYK